MFVDRNGNPTSEALPANLLLGVTDSYGKALSFAYSAPETLVVMTDPSGGRTIYAYDLLATNENLASVTYPDGRTRRYLYAEPANLPSGYSSLLPRALTSIVDENGDLYGSFKYDTNGRVLSSEHALGAELYQFTRPNATTTNITDPLGTTRAFSFQVVDCGFRPSRATVPIHAGPAFRSMPAGVTRWWNCALEGVWQPQAAHREVGAAGCMGERAGDEALADVGGAGDEEVSGVRGSSRDR